MARKTKEDAEKTYHALLDAAADLFQTQGYASTTLAEIASQAGMTRGAVYWHFKSKVDIVKAIWENHAKPGFEPVRQGLIDLPDDNPAKAYRAQMDKLMDIFSGESRVGRAMYIIMHNMEISEKEGELFEFLGQQHQMMEGVVRQAIVKIHQKGQLNPKLDPEYAAKGCLCMIIGMINKALLPFTGLNLEVDGRIIINSYLDALLVETKAPK